MGLVLIDFEKRTVRFAGARIALYWYDGQEINCVSGASRALCDRRHGTYKDYDLALLPGFTYYLTTDGFLDQSGGEHGFSIGDDRYRAWLTEHAAKPMQQQLQSLTNALSTFQGSYPQRDDITLLALRFN